MTVVVTAAVGFAVPLVISLGVFRNLASARRAAAEAAGAGGRTESPNVLGVLGSRP